MKAEENSHGYFQGDLDFHPSQKAANGKEVHSIRGGEAIGEHPEKLNYMRYGVPNGRYAWGRFHQRFDINAEPNEANRFGWIVEVDPLDPRSTPVKRTALGRFKHEGAECIVNGDGRLVLYSGDHGATTFGWDILIKAGNPADTGVAALWNPATSENGWFSCPDNCAVDHEGRLWVATDQGTAWKEASGSADGVWAVETEGEGRGTGRMFFRVPVGAEMCGPRFTPDDKTLFIAVQHPATDGTKAFPGFERSSTFEDPATRWPGFDPGMPPRPSVVVVTKNDGGVIGS